jgi:Protein of unknown function (DUF1573)
MNEQERTLEQSTSPKSGGSLQGASIAALCILLVLLAGYILSTKGTQVGNGGTANPKANAEANNVGQARRDGAAAATEAGTPRLVVEKERVDLGDITLGKTVQVKIGLTNAGQQTLRITEPPYVEVVEGCCPPEPAVDATSLAPGQTIQLSMQFMMHEGMGGKHLFRVHVKTNDPSQPDRTLEVLSNWVK